MKFDRAMLALYAVTDRGQADKSAFFEQIESALRGGVTMLQLREKALSEDEFIDEALKVKSICARYNVPLIINDSVTVALKSGADGVHVGAEDAPVTEIKRLAPKDFIIGATCKTIKQAKRAEGEGADYIGVGAVFPSPTKANAIRISSEQLKKICSSVSIPAVAIGGISEVNALTLRGCGIAGIAVVSALFGANDVESAAKRLKALSDEIIRND